MARTVLMEELPPDTQRVVEELLSSDSPIIFSRGGQTLGGMIAYAPPNGSTPVMTPEEEADIITAIAQGEADYAAGHYVTLDAFKAKYAAKLQEKMENRRDSE